MAGDDEPNVLGLAVSNDVMLIESVYDAAADDACNGDEGGESGRDKTGETVLGGVNADTVLDMTAAAAMLMTFSAETILDKIFR